MKEGHNNHENITLDVALVKWLEGIAGPLLFASLSADQVRFTSDNVHFYEIRFLITRADIRNFAHHKKVSGISFLRHFSASMAILMTIQTKIIIWYLEQ